MHSWDFRNPNVIRQELLAGLYEARARMSEIKALHEQSRDAILQLYDAGAVAETGPLHLRVEDRQPPQVSRTTLIKMLGQQEFERLLEHERKPTWRYVFVENKEAGLYLPNTGSQSTRCRARKPEDL